MRRVAAALVGAGIVVWVLGVAAWAGGVWVTLPPDAVRTLVLALAAVAGGVLLVAGAAVGRAARRAGTAAGAAPGPAPVTPASLDRAQRGAPVGLLPNESLQLRKAGVAPAASEIPTSRVRN